MKISIIILFYILGIALTAAPQAKERLESLLLDGIDAFEKNICIDAQAKKGVGAISYFEDYINLGGNKSDVLKYLAYCKISIGQSKEDEIDTLKSGVQLLSEVFENNNKDIEVLKLLLFLYIQLKDYDKAKTYAILTKEEGQIDNDMYILLARLYFNTKEYNKVVDYALKYQINEKNKDLKPEKLFMIAYSYFKSKDNKNAKLYFNKLIKEKNIDKEFIRLSKETLKIINQNENFGKYSSWYNITLTNGIVFDSNILSQPPFSQNGIAVIPGVPDININSSSLTSMGVRDENYISLFFYPLNLNEHSIIININNFMAFHYPKVIEDIFDPQDYDTINASAFVGYEYHKYFTKKNVLKLFLYGGYDSNWINPINNFNIYSNSIKTGLNIYYKFENNIDIALYSSLSIENYNENSIVEDKLSQDGKYFNSILATSLPITSGFILSLTAGYIGSQTTGDLFNYNGFLASSGLSFELFDFLELSGSIIFEKKSYESNDRSDQLMVFGGNINLDLGSYFDLDLSYSYSDNDSTIDEFLYKKHLISLYFNFTM